ncbi:MAG: aminotransferase class IV [Chloroflexota bacterium]
MTSTRERVVYFNGEIVPESKALIPFRDRSFKYGDGAFDMTRTFGHRIFKLEEHIERYYKTLKYFQLEPGMSPKEMMQKTEEVLEANLPLLADDEDYWVGQRVSRGVDVVGGEMWESTGPNVIIECAPLPLRARATLYRDGMEVIVPSVRRTPPESLSPRAKSHNYLNLIMGDLEVKAQNQKAWAILLDTRGYLTEGIGSNFFAVKDGVIRTPKPQYVLGGISQETVVELADQLEIPVEQEDMDLYDAYVADEVFLTSTSLCVCGVRTVNGVEIGDGRVPGPITEALTDAYIDLVDYDWVSQYLKRLEE